MRSPKLGTQMLVPSKTGNPAGPGPTGTDGTMLPLPSSFFSVGPSVIQMLDPSNNTPRVAEKPVEKVLTVVPSGLILKTEAPFAVHIEDPSDVIPPAPFTGTNVLLGRRWVLPHSRKCLEVDTSTQGWAPG